MPGGFSIQAAAAGALAALVGFGSSFPVVVRGLTAVGADQAQAASGLMALSIAMGLCAIVVSLRTRMPISIAWSTPGAALLAATAAPEGGFGGAVGAFLIAGALIVLAGFWKALGRAVAAIPPTLANGMLAGVLLGLCLAPFRAVVELPVPGLAIIVAWAAVARLHRLLAVPAAVLVTLVLVVATTPLDSVTGAALWPDPVVTAPSFSLSAAIGIALPLFIVTMASQNLPGVAVLNASGYRPDPGPLLRATGAFTMLAAPFGAHAVNLAAITAALCAGADAHPDPRRRYWAAVVAGVVYVAFGIMAAAATAFIAASPPILIEAAAGLALIGAFSAATAAALADAQEREAAVVTFLVTASGLSFFGISGPFWGLLAGGAILALTRWRRNGPPS